MIANRPWRFEANLSPAPNCKEKADRLMHDHRDSDGKVVMLDHIFRPERRGYNSAGEQYNHRS
jgi:hypothetical protein